MPRAETRVVTVKVGQYDLPHLDLPHDQKLVPVGGGAGREFAALHLPGLCDAFGGGEDLAPAVAGVQGVHGLIELRGIAPPVTGNPPRPPRRWMLSLACAYFTKLTSRFAFLFASANLAILQGSCKVVARCVW